MLNLEANVKYNSSTYRVWAIKTEPIDDKTKKVIYCLEHKETKKRIEVTEEELKCSKK
jgi:hypothetical protein